MHTSFILLLLCVGWEITRGCGNCDNLRREQIRGGFVGEGLALQPKAKGRVGRGEGGRKEFETKLNERRVEDNGNRIKNENAKEDEFEADFATSTALASLKFYKTIISPILPPSCRFLPTCSEYSKEAFVKFGPQKGFILTAWRLVRCSPIGGKGYDPPKWPPGGLKAGGV